MTSPRGAHTAAHCRGCRGPRPKGLYLCCSCWDALPAPARNSLLKQDDQTRTRLRQLYAHLDTEAPFEELRVTP